MPLFEPLQSVKLSIEEDVKVEAHEDDEDDVYGNFGLVLFAVVVQLESVNCNVSFYCAHLRFFKQDFYV